MKCLAVVLLAIFGLNEAGRIPFPNPSTKTTTTPPPPPPPKPSCGYEVPNHVNFSHDH